MTASDWFEDLLVLGQMSPSEAESKLAELDESEAAEALAVCNVKGKSIDQSSNGKRVWWPFSDRPWQHTAHTFGYIALECPGCEDFLPIKHAGAIDADKGLMNQAVKITLDCLRIASYPGKGVHRVLFDFYTQSQVSESVEHVHFSTSYRIKEGERAAIIGYPIFVGINVGSEGLALKCFTVNVKNDSDESMIGFLESDIFREGLKLTTTIQPAVRLFSETVVALTRAVAGRNRNVPVQDFYMGLDFSNVSTRARLSEGSYIAVQIPESVHEIWDWNEWVYHKVSGNIVKKADLSELIPYNYAVLGVSRLERD